MSTVNIVIEKTPLPVKLIYFLTIVTFFIYIPISLFRTDKFLLILDLVLIYCLLLTVLNKRMILRVFGGKTSILFFVLLYVFSVILRFLVDLFSFEVQLLVVVRNLLFGMGIFLVSSVWMCKQKRVDQIIKIFVWAGVITSIYGIRQLLFGYMQFELDRIALMGSSLKEMNVLNRFRLTSSFGDPLLFGFFMMICIFYYLLARKRGIVSKITINWHPWSLIIMILALILSLTRAPLLGLICGIVLIFLLNFKIKRNILSRISKIIAGILLFIFSLNLLIASNFLENKEIKFLNSINNGVKSFNSLYQMITYKNDVYSQAEYFFVHQSKNSRLKFWNIGISYLYNNPMGAGLTNLSEFTFSVGDTGILSLGLKVGVIGLFSMVILLFLIGLSSYFRIKSISSSEFKGQSYFFLGMWLSIIIVNSISSVLDSSVLSIVIWVIAGILVNQKRIYKDYPNR